MAYNPPPAFGKLVVTATDVNGKVVNETLGYTDINVFDDATTEEQFDTLMAFTHGVMNLTTSTYLKSTATYEAELDNIG